MADKDKQKAMAELWLSNLSQYPARVMFDDIPLEYRINAFIDGTMQLSKDWTTNILPYMRCVSSSLTKTGSVATLTFEVKEAHVNRLGNLHGGCAATVFDLATTLPLALVGRPGAWQQLGVSRNLGVTYLRPVPAGTTVFLECEVVHAARSMAATRGVMRIGSADGPVACFCEHDKFNIDAPAGGRKGKSKI